MRVSYLLPCPCGARVRVMSVQAGETVPCPACGATLTVPTWRDLRRLEPAGRPERRDRQTRWDARRIWMMMGLYVTAGALILLVVLQVRRPELPDTTALSPLESWEMWMSLRQGLSRRVSWQTYEVIEAHRALRLHTFICLGTAALGLAVSALAFLRRKRTSVPPHSVR